MEYEAANDREIDEDPDNDDGAGAGAEEVCECVCVCVCLCIFWGSRGPDPNLSCFVALESRGWRWGIEANPQHTCTRLMKKLPCTQVLFTRRRIELPPNRTRCYQCMHM